MSCLVFICVLIVKNAVMVMVVVTDMVIRQREFNHETSFGTVQNTVFLHLYYVGNSGLVNLNIYDTVDTMCVFPQLSVVGL